jgi:hypothetical protein
LVGSSGVGFVRSADALIILAVSADWNVYECFLRSRVVPDQVFQNSRQQRTNSFRAVGREIIEIFLDLDVRDPLFVRRRVHRNRLACHLHQTDEYLGPLRAPGFRHLFGHLATLRSVSTEKSPQAEFLRVRREFLMVDSILYHRRNPTQVKLFLNWMSDRRL